MSTSPTVVIAYIREDARYAPVRVAAISAALTAKAELILYDADSASLFSSPLPSFWSADSAERPVGNRLSPEELETAGRHDLAEHVRNARSAGVETFGWLASSRGASDFTDYADTQGADLLVVPEDLEDEGLIARLRRAPAPGEIADCGQDSPDRARPRSSLIRFNRCGMASSTKSPPSWAGTRPNQRPAGVVLGSGCESGLPRRLKSRRGPSAYRGDALATRPRHREDAPPSG